MGYELMRAAMNPYWAARLRDPEFRLLLHMCDLAMDKAKCDMDRASFWASQRTVMVMLYGREYAPGEPGYETKRQAIRRSLRALEKAGAIRCVERARNGHNARYRITVDEWRLPVDNSDGECLSVLHHGSPVGYTTVALRATPQ
jgi:hypothetical protein